MWTAWDNRLVPGAVATGDLGAAEKTAVATAPGTDLRPPISYDLECRRSSGAPWLHRRVGRGRELFPFTSKRPLLVVRSQASIRKDRLGKCSGMEVDRVEYSTCATTASIHGDECNSARQRRDLRHVRQVRRCHSQRAISGVGRFGEAVSSFAFGLCDRWKGRDLLW